MEIGRFHFYILILNFLFGCSEYNDNYKENVKELKKEVSGNNADSISVNKVIDTVTGNYTYSEFAAGKVLLRKWEETQINGGLATLWENHYYKNGELEKRVEFEYSSGTTYHETHIIKKTEEFHPNGKIKSRQFKESFMMGEECDCGLWEYFDESGKLTKKDQKRGNCEDLELDCI